MAKPRTKAKPTSVFSAEIVDTLALLHRDENLARQRIDEAHRRLRHCVQAYRGRIGETRDDELLATFGRPAEAVVAALAFQAAQKEVNRHIHDEIRVEARIGIAFGEAVIGEATLTGAGVVLAQRIEQTALPGAVVIDESTYDALPEELPIQYRALDERGQKGHEGQAHSYHVSLRDGASLPSPRKMKFYWALAAGLGLLVILLLALFLL